MKSINMTPTSKIAAVPTLHTVHTVPAHHICYLSGDEAEPNPLDMLLHNQIAKLTAGVSPTSVTLAFVDWAMHLAASPGKQLELLALLQKPSTLSLPVSAPVNPASGSEADSRFAHPGWSNWPYNAMSGGFLKTQQFWQAATTGVRGMSAHHEYVVNFISRQMLDMLSPSNLPYLNPEVLQTTVETGGKNLLSGASHWLQDQGLELSATEDASGHAGSKKLAYQVGRDVAITPGKVVFRNHLIELIQYSPQTNQVYAEPILIVPSWIMKYYILDLSPHNSMVRFLVAQGHTVFMISWRNPGKEARDLGMQDYLNSGLFAALAEVAAITHKAVHTVGYCLGGTLLAMGAAALAKETSSTPELSSTSIKSVSLLAAQTDFSEPGELGLFIDESQLAMLDAQMWKKGYLDGDQMTGSFQILNSRDLVWSKIMREYQLGSRTAANDLMSWNADTTRMPYRMHSEYLKHLFLHNDLAEGRYEVDGQAIALNDLRQPMFVVGTARDHVSPWRSVYKINLLSDAPIEFVLASGGHNAGIVSEPGHARRSYQYLPAGARSKNYSAPEAWLQAATTEAGSWWTHWQHWLAQHSAAKQIKARYPQDHPELGIAPGRYVLEP
jgi:polyhydroxyalkanoate synthase